MENFLLAGSFVCAGLSGYLAYIGKDLIDIAQFFKVVAVASMASVAILLALISILLGA